MHRCEPLCCILCHHECGADGQAGRLANLQAGTINSSWATTCSIMPLDRRGETVAVCTMEKANVALNKLAQEGRLGEAAPHCTVSSALIS